MWILLIVSLLLVLLIWFYYVSFIKSLFITKVPYVGTFNKDLKLLEQLDLRRWKLLIDLWCGDWKALRFFVKKFWIKGEGYDLNWFAIWWGKVLNKIFWCDIKLYRKNFYDVDIKKAHYIYLFLMPDVMEDVENFVFENKSSDTVIIVNSFPFPNKKPFKVIGGKIYLYK